MTLIKFIMIRLLIIMNQMAYQIILASQLNIYLGWNRKWKQKKGLPI